MKTKEQAEAAEQLMQEVENELVSAFSRLGIMIHDMHHTGEGEVTIIYDTDQDHEDFLPSEVLMKVVEQQQAAIDGLQKQMIAVTEAMKYLAPYGVQQPKSECASVADLLELRDKTQEDTNLKDLVNGRLTDSFMSARGFH